LCGFLLLLPPGPSYGQNLSADDLARRAIERRAVEVVNWGMPAVNYDLMLQEMLNKTEGRVNQVIYWSRPLDWHNQTLTPNPDAIYFMAFFNTKDGPIVVDVPRADDAGSLNANFVDLWQMPLEDAGLHGVDKGAGVKFVILPPGYGGAIPAEHTPLRPATFGSDVYFGPAAPAGKESNWVPTKAGAGFEVMFRAYAPTKAFFDKTWRLADIEPMLESRPVSGQR
jgi:hypothetical protein